MTSNTNELHDLPSMAKPISPFAVIRKALKPLASLQLTVSLLAFSVGLVFFGTLAQKTSGLWTVVDRYFWSWFVFVDLEPILEFGKIFFYLPQSWKAPTWAGFPYPGGKLIGGLMFLNLLAAHAVRFRLSWKRIGIVIAHTGLLLLFIGEAITRECQVEQRMTIKEGEAVNFTEDTKTYELAFTTPDADGTQRVTVIPARKLANSVGKGIISDPELPVDVRVERYMVNSYLLSPQEIEIRKADRKPVPDDPATAGLGLQRVAEEQPEANGLGNQADVASAYVTLINKQTAQAIGTYLVSLWFCPDPFNRAKDLHQSFALDGTTINFSLRATRYYKPFSLYLEKFRFDRYIGTESPKNFSSELKLLDPERGQDRNVLIKMNEPLRYRGETFYQADYDKISEKATVLQVVRNPGALLPYLACAFVSGGLTLHFLIVLTRFLMRPRSRQVSQSADSIGLIVAILAVLLLIFRFGFGRQLFDDFLGPIGGGSGSDFGVRSQLLMLSLAFLVPVCLTLIFRKLLTVNRTVETHESSPATVFEKVLPWCTAISVVFFFCGLIAPKASSEKFDLPAAERIPVVDGGRVKPLDTAARVYLRKISGKEEYIAEDGKVHPAIRWILDIMSASGRNSPGYKHKIIRIENDQVLSLLGLQRREGLRYSLEEIGPRVADIQNALNNLKAYSADKPIAEPRLQKLFESGNRKVFEGQLQEVGEKIRACDRLLSHAMPLMLPPDGDRPWRSLKDVEENAEKKAYMSVFLPRGILPKDVKDLPKEQQESLAEEMNEEISKAMASDASATRLQNLFIRYRMADASKFDEALREFTEATSTPINTDEQSRVRFEVILNEAAYTYNVIYVYVIAAVFSLGGWVALIFRPVLAESLRRSAYWSLLAAFVAHGFALAARMYLMDRPLVFVTNLYSTAVFIGWAAVGLGLILERIFPLGLGNFLASVVGGATAIIAHNLATSSDTLEMMQAVLDSNFWLATHVTTINLGYSTTYVAGVAAIAYILLGIFTPVLDVVVKPVGDQSPRASETIGKALGKLMYGVVCLATLTSFVGTVLGGIWADDSWGRFWGWDPKENGAVLIVIWNAMILHARWCGLVKDRGTAVLCLGGNMITTWSYFGTNQLGVGLHAYGFNSTLAILCLVTWLVNMVLIGVGLIPTSFWKSGYSLPKTEKMASVDKPAEAAKTQRTKGKKQPTGR